MRQEKPAQKIKQVSCPTCRSLTEFSSKNPYRPFCSQRCKMIDLGDWADESYRIPDKSPPKDLDDIN